MKKRLVSVFLCAAMAVSLAACGGNANNSGNADNGGAAADNGGTAQAAEANTKDFSVAVVLHSLGGSFYTKIADGAEQAGKDLGINVTVSAPSQASSLDEQVSLLETAIASGVDAIATVTWDPSGFNDVIASANAKGIPVVSFNQRADDCGDVCFIGQDYASAGYDLGQYMFDEVMDGEGSYIIASCGPTDVALVAREAGIDDAASEYPGIEKITTIDIGTDLNNAYSVIENAYLAHPDVDAILGVDVFSEAIGNFIEDYNLTGEVYGAGFDLTEGMLGHIKNGSVQLTVGQNPWLQGYYAVLECFMGGVHGQDYLNIDTGAQMVTKDNVEGIIPE